MWLNLPFSFNPTKTTCAYYIILVNNVIDLLVCTLFGSELATEITLSGVKATLFFLPCVRIENIIPCSHIDVIGQVELLE